MRTAIVALIVCAAGAGIASAQTPKAGGAAAPRLVEGPAPPQAPEVYARDDKGRVTIRATRLTEALHLDGELNEKVYETVQPIPGLIQNVPDEGKPSSERTEIWVLFDDANFYVSARLWDRSPPSEWVVDEMRRDSFQVNNNENFGFMIDTFYDHRNGSMFFANPIGAIRDFQITNEASLNGDWNAVWDARPGRFEGGWTLEIQIPFKSLRYGPTHEQVWGIQFRRGIKHKNEWAYLTAVPATAGASAWARISNAATLVGLEAPPAHRNLDVTPYAIAGVRTDNTASPAQINDLSRNVGFDVKYGLTKNALLDATYNTDFAQVEVDEQQINLTRFNLLFPEKRDFFLENRGLYDFGVGNNNVSGLAAVNPQPQLFFSRRIGLENGRAVSIRGGGRLTGQFGPVQVGALNIQTEADSVARTPSTNFTVLRLRRNVFARSGVGVMVTNRSASTAASGNSNGAMGADSAFSFGDVNMNGYYARTRTPGRTGHEESYVGHIDYLVDRYSAVLDYNVVGDRFNPEVGYVQRNNMKRTFAAARFSPRPRRIPMVRQVAWTGTFEYVDNIRGVHESENEGVTFWSDFRNSDRVTVGAARNFDRLSTPFRLAGGPVIGVGGYTYSNVSGSYAFGTQRRLSGTVSAQSGTYYNGTQRNVTLSAGRYGVSRRLYLEPSFAVNWFDFPTQSLRASVYRTRGTFTFTPRMFVSALVQYTSTTKTVGSNIRFRWEYTPGSSLIVAYTDDRDTTGLRPTTSLLDRGLVMKVNRLMRF